MVSNLKKWFVFSNIFMDCMLGCSEIVRSSWWQTLFPGGVELSSATSAFSKINEDGLCGAWEVLMLRPIESLLLLQLGCMIKCHLSHHPLSPTCRLLSISHCLSVCYSGSVPCCLCYLVLFITSLSTFLSFFSLSFCSVSFPCQLPFALHCTAFLNYLSLILPHSPLVSLAYPLLPLSLPLFNS